MPNMPSPAIGLDAPQVNLPDPFRRITPREDDRAAYAVGSGLSDVGNTLAAIQHQDGVRWANETLPAMQEGSIDDAQAAQKSAGPGASGYTKTVMDAFEKRAQAALEQAPDRQSRQFMQQAISRLHLETYARATAYEATQQVQYQDETNQKALDVSGNELLLHPEVFAQRLAERNSLIDQMSASADYKAKWKDTNQQQLAAYATQGLIKSDALGVIKQLKSDSPTDMAIAALNPKQREMALQQAQGAFVDQKGAAITDTYRTGGAQAGLKALQAVDNDPSIPADLKDQVRAAANKGLGQLREEAQATYVKQISDMHENIAKGQATDADRATAQWLYQKNALSPMEYTGVIDAIDRSQTKDAGDEVWRLTVADAIQNGKPLDPSRKVVKDAVGLYFQNATSGTAPGSAQYANAAADIAGKTGVVPEPVMAWARSSLVSGDPKSAASAASTIGMIQERNPRALEYADDDKRVTAMVSTINEAVRAGADPVTAVTQARQLANITKSDEERLHQLWQEQGATKTQGNALVDRVKGNFAPGIFDSVPLIPAALRGEFDKATQRYFDLTGGNLKQARDLAAADVQRVWGVSRVNGDPEIMPYAPERMFPGLDPKLIREDIAETVKGSDTDPKDVHLIYLDQTARTGGVTWGLGVKDKEGAYDVVRDDKGNPRLYNLPVNQVDYQAVQDRSRQAQLDKARQLQKDREASYQALYGRSTIEAQP